MRPLFVATVFALLVTLSLFLVHLSVATPTTQPARVHSAKQRLPTAPQTGPTRRENATQCVISCRGTDGVGHQLEAKISCMVVARELGMSYVYYPLAGHARHFENFFGLGRRAVGPGSLIMTDRKPLPHVGKCDLPSWLDAPRCEAGRVYIADNCWDYLFCHTVRSPRFAELWAEVRTEILEDYYATPKPETGFAANQTNILVHIRRGDAAWMIQSDSYFLGAIRALRTRFPGARFWIHTNEPGELNAEYTATDTVVAQARMRTTEDSRGWENATARMMHQFIEADVLILSWSSLSNALGLLSRAHLILYPACERERPLGLLGKHWRAFACDGIGTLAN